MDSMEQFTKVSLAKKLAILVIFMALVGGAYWYLYYMPLIDEMTQLDQQAVVLAQDKAKALRSKQSFEDDKRKLAKLEETVGDQLKALPNEREKSMYSFLGQLSNQAELVGLMLEKVTPKKEDPEKYFIKIPIELELKGTYYQLAKFFFLVGSMDRIINLENIVFTVDDIEENEALLDAKVMATTFRSIKED